MKKIILFITLCLGIQCFCFSQDNDFEGWTAFKIQKKLNSKISIALEENFRYIFSENSTKNFFTELTAKYKLNKNVSFKLGYRYIQKNDESGFEYYHRINTDLKLKKKIDRFKLSYRLRYQHFDKAFSTIETTSDAVNHIRNRFLVSYDIPKNKVTPFISSELFYEYGPNDESEFNKLRFSVGASYKFENKNTIKMYMMRQSELNKKTNDKSLVLGLNYTLKL